MTLLERLAARQCRFVTCSEPRIEGSDLCAEHTTDKYMHRLDRDENDNYVQRRRFPAVDRTWERAA